MMHEIRKKQVLNDLKWLLHSVPSFSFLHKLILMRVKSNAGTKPSALSLVHI